MIFFFTRNLEISIHFSKIKECFQLHKTLLCKKEYPWIVFEYVQKNLKILRLSIL